ncbi:MAG: hypothetical protein QM775_19620 [Pirellulales bacterium]
MESDSSSPVAPQSGPASDDREAASLNPFSRRSAFVFGVLLFVVGWLVYRVTFGFELLTWDDNLHVTDNEHFRRLSWRSFAYFWGWSYIYLYIPVSYNFYGLEVAVARLFPGDDPTKLNAAVFHIGNVLVHLGCTLLAYRILLKLVCNAPAAFLARRFLPASVAGRERGVGRRNARNAGDAVLVPGTEPVFALGRSAF